MSAAIVLPASPTPTPAPSAKSAPREIEQKPDIAKKDNDAIEREQDKDVSPDIFSEMMQALYAFMPSQKVAAPKETAVSVAPVVTQPSSAAAQTPAVASVPSGDAVTAKDTAGFGDQLLSGLTQGTPQLPDVASAALPPTVPVPEVTPENLGSAMNSLLTVNSDTPASDPRIVVCGFQPAGLDKFKNLPANPALLPCGYDPGVPGKLGNALPKPVAESLPAPLTNSTGDANPVLVANTMTVNPNAAETLQAAAATIDPEVLASTNAADTVLFDPVEFRIAQKFSAVFEDKPAGQSSHAGQAAQAFTLSTPANANAGNATGFSFLNNQPKPDAVMSSFNGHASVVDDAALSALTGNATADYPVTVNPLMLNTGSSSPLTSPITQSPSAVASNPVIHSVANIVGNTVKTEGPKELVLQLDPPELGRLQIKMKYEKGEPLKVHVVLEKADTAAMFQRDAHALESSLKDAGLQLDMSSLSFELAKDGSPFQQAMGDNNGQGNGGNHQHQSHASVVDASIPVLETQMDIYTDGRGQTRYNLKV